MKYALTDVIEDLLGHPVPERGQNAMVRCPFHGDDRPSMSIDLDRGLWVCFACGEKGGVNRLARLLDREVNEGEVLIRSMEAAIERQYEEPPDFTGLAENLHENAWAHEPITLVSYIAERRLHASVFRKFKLGWDPGHGRISMPFYDDGRVIGIRYRYADGSKGSEKGSKRYLYNVDDVRGRPVVILCEGESDTHAVYSELVRLGLEHEVGATGFPGVSASRANWELYALEFMWAQRVYVLYDADEAGDKGAVIPMQVLGDKAVRARPTRGNDITEHLLNGGTFDEAGVGVADLRSFVDDREGVSA